MFVFVGYGQSSALRLEVDHLDPAAQHSEHHKLFPLWPHLTLTSPALSVGHVKTRRGALICPSSSLSAEKVSSMISVMSCQQSSWPSSPAVDLQTTWTEGHYASEHPRTNC